MPPARRRKTTVTPKEETVTTTEEITDETDADVAPESVTEDEATTKRRAATKPEDAVFLAQFEVSAPPKRVNARAYVRTPYDDVVDQLWARYEDAGKPHWSLSGDLTKDDRPVDGWWSDRTDIWMSTIVPDVEAADSLIRRAAFHKGISYRLKFNQDEDKKPVAEESGGYRIWFTVAPVLKNKPKDS